MNKITLLFLSLLLSGLLMSGCSTAPHPTNTNAVNTRMWLPAAGPVDWGRLFTSENVSFTVSYRIEKSGDISNIELSNIVPSTPVDKEALALIASTKFVATTENPGRKPVTVSNRIEINARPVPVLVVQ